VKATALVAVEGGQGSRRAFLDQKLATAQFGRRRCHEFFLYHSPCQPQSAVPASRDVHPVWGFPGVSSADFFKINGGVTPQKELSHIFSAAVVGDLLLIKGEKECA